MNMSQIIVTAASAVIGVALIAGTVYTLAGAHQKRELELRVTCYLDCRQRCSLVEFPDTGIRTPEGLPGGMTPAAGPSCGEVCTSLCDRE